MKRKRCVTLGALLIAMALLLCSCFDMIDGPGMVFEDTSAESQATPDVEVSVVPESKVLAKAKYPEMAAYPADGEWCTPAYDAWYEQVEERQKLLWDNAADLTAFYTRTMGTFLTDTKGENRVYSPLNVYLALGMLAQTAGGDSRSQLLELLGTADMEALQQRCNRLWNGIYRDDGAVTCRLANSMWLADDVTYKQAPLDTLAQQYYASSFSGKMGSAEYNAMLQNWLNEQTDGLLEQQAGEVELHPETVLALASTLTFSARWTDEFAPENTESGEFSAPQGKVTVDYLHQQTFDHLYDGDTYTAFAKTMDGSNYRMWLVLPHEGVTPEELAGDSLVVKRLTAYGGTDSWNGCIKLAVPKFDVVSDLSLVSGLEKLGVTAMFDPGKADFSPLLEDPAFVNDIKHAARVKIDEEGCEAAAYTVEMLDGSAPPPDQVREFVLDRPFLFAVTGPGDTLLFTGIVNQP